jgi:Zn-finger nucleic acid-binding protein
MSKYKEDRAFTNHIHKDLAVPLIYEPLNWGEVKLRKDYAKYIDMMDGIDYVFRNEGEIMSVQERFRDAQYKDFSDFTIRYRRDENKIKERHKSEYYKMKAHYFTYGIIKLIIKTRKILLNMQL